MKKVYMNNVFGSLFGTLLLISSGWVSISAEEAQMSTEDDGGDGALQPPRGDADLGLR